MATIVLTMTPEFHREIGFPRTAAIEYPYGRAIGQVGDSEGQKKVLLDTLAALQNAQEPGQIVHLPFEWPEDPRKTKWHPPEASPIIKVFLGEIKKAGAEARK
ncbi:MAG: hypothetical protein GY866_31465 [Proteobacteria bacterium]|nr:hypothetical protein [Pseudomonadota bacterium]